MEGKIIERVGNIEVRLWFDEWTNPANPGWYAEYYGVEEDDEDETPLLAHSGEVWHPDMPTDPDAEEEALAIVREYAESITE